MDGNTKQHLLLFFVFQSITWSEPHCQQLMLFKLKQPPQMAPMKFYRFFSFSSPLSQICHLRYWVIKFNWIEYKDDWTHQKSNALCEIKLNLPVTWCSSYSAPSADVKSSRQWGWRRPRDLLTFGWAVTCWSDPPGDRLKTWMRTRAGARIKDTEDKDLTSPSRRLQAQKLRSFGPATTGVLCCVLSAGLSSSLPLSWGPWTRLGWQRKSVPEENDGKNTARNRL